MAVTAQTGILSFGGQSGKGTVSSTFYQHRAADIDLSTTSDDRLGPPEVGGINTPTIPYRAGVLVSGGATINPRLENTVGWMLHGALGSWSATQDENVFGTADTGVYHHVFKFASDSGFVPYMSFRKYIPGETATDDLGETFLDCKIVNLALALPNDGLINARVDVLGREPSFDDDPTWTYGNTEMEDYQSIPIGSVTGGYLKVPTFSATALPITAANVTLTNAPLDVRQEKNFGSPYLDEVTVIGRSLTVDLVVKWKDPQLYMSILTGSTTGTQWTAAPWVNDLDVYALSTDVIPSQASPYQLRVQAPEIMYQLNGGIRLAGNNAVMMRITGTAIAPSSGDYCTIDVANKATDYTWPT
jgi:hypothetical protein